MDKLPPVEKLKTWPTTSIASTQSGEAEARRAQMRQRKLPKYIESLWYYGTDAIRIRDGLEPIYPGQK